MQNTNKNNNLGVKANPACAVSGLVSRKNQRFFLKYQESAEGTFRDIGWNTTKYLSGMCPVCGQMMVVHLEEHSDGFTYMDRSCSCGYSEVVE